MRRVERHRLACRDANGGARLTPALVEALAEGLRQAPTGAVVTLEGPAGEFCSGLDLTLATTVSPAQRRAGLAAFFRLLEAIGRAPRLVVAVVDGPARGGGVGLAASADLVVATPRATFALPETCFGVIPASVFPFLAGRIGLARAKSLALLGTTLSAARAFEWGLVDELTDDPDAAVARAAQRSSWVSADAFATMKRIAAEHFAVPQGYETAALDQLDRLLGSADTALRLERFAAGSSPWADPA